MSSIAIRRHWLPVGSGEFFRRRAIEAAGAGLIVLAVLFAAALATYSPLDPSPNHALGRPASNLLGLPGAAVADVALQSLGLAAAIPAVVLLAWGFRLVRVHRLPLWWARLALLPLAVLCAATALAFLQAPAGWPRPFEVGLGGIAGRLCLAWILAPMQGLGLGAAGLSALAGAIAAAALVFLLAVTWIEWRAAAQGFATGLSMASALAQRAMRMMPRLRLRYPGRLRAEDKAERRRERREPGMQAPAAEDAPEPAPDKEKLALGEKLTGSDGGFNCMTCHALKEQAATAVFEAPGVNLGNTAERVRKAWFHRWLLAPLRVDAETKMPKFSEDGVTTQITDVLGGKAADQFEAIWQYLHSLN